MANYYNDAENSAVQKQQASIGGAALGGGLQAGYAREPSMSEESQKAMQHHYGEAEKASKVSNFLQSHPEFEQFIKLIRSGAIHF